MISPLLPLSSQLYNPNKMMVWCHDTVIITIIDHYWWWNLPLNPIKQHWGPIKIPLDSTDIPLKSHIPWISPSSSPFSAWHFGLQFSRLPRFRSSRPHYRPGRRRSREIYGDIMGIYPPVNSVNIQKAIVKWRLTFFPGSFQVSLECRQIISNHGYPLVI